MNKQYFGTDFKIEKFTNFDGGTIVSYTQTDTENPYKLSATELGVRFEGKLEIQGEDNLRDLARLIADVWKDHVKIAPKITSVTGH